MLTLAILLLALVVGASAVAVVAGLARLHTAIFMLIDEARDMGEAVDQLRLKSRARVATARVRTGPVTEEAELIRLGRASRGKTKVFGGEEGSLQHSQVEKQVGQ